MTTPHKHAEVIKAWADGHRVEVLDWIDNTWCEVSNTIIPGFLYMDEYRIKPKGDVVRHAKIQQGECYVYNSVAFPEDNCRFTFDGETGKLKSAEVIK